MKVATYNVNSINARLPNLLAFLVREKPDILMLQEIKCSFNDFPLFELNSAGYNVKFIGQKSYNGVAILSPHKILNVIEGLPKFDDENARYIEADVMVEGDEVRVASLYLPNGNPPYNNPDDESKFLYKLNWMNAFYARAAQLLESGKKVILGGDYNVILTDFDVYNPEMFRNNALFREEVKQRLKAIEYLGYYDAYRCLHPTEVGYTYWDYAGSALAMDQGMRIDYLLLSAKAVDALDACYVDRQTRSGDKPSDHAPLVAVFK